MFRGDFMRTFKKIAALLLALSLAAGLAACGDAPQEQELPAPDEPDAVETVGEGLVSTLVIKQEELPGGLAELSAMNTAGEGLILAGWDAAASPVLGTLGADGGFSALPLPEDVVSVAAVCRDGDAVAALAFDRKYALAQAVAAVQIHALRRRTAGIEERERDPEAGAVLEEKRAVD